jgi:hypothetical protein
MEKKRKEGREEGRGEKKERSSPNLSPLFPLPPLPFFLFSFFHFQFFFSLSFLIFLFSYFLFFCAADKIVEQLPEIIKKSIIHRNLHENEMKNFREFDKRNYGLERGWREEQTEEEEEEEDRESRIFREFQFEYKISKKSRNILEKNENKEEENGRSDQIVSRKRRHRKILSENTKQLLNERDDHIRNYIESVDKNSKTFSEKKSVKKSNENKITNTLNIFDDEKSNNLKGTHRTSKHRILTETVKTESNSTTIETGKEVEKETEKEKEIEKEKEKKEKEINMTEYSGLKDNNRNVYVYIASDNEIVKEAFSVFLTGYHPQIKGIVKRSCSSFYSVLFPFNDAIRDLFLYRL